MHIESSYGRMHNAYLFHFYMNQSYWTCQCRFYYIIIMLQMDLTLYDPEASKSSTMIGCDNDFCTSTYDGPISGCTKDMSCPYSITYGDGSTTSGSYVKDYLTFDRASGDLKTVPENSTVIFG